MQTCRSMQITIRASWIWRQVLIDALALDIGVANYQIASRGSGYVVLDEYLSTEQYGIGF